LDFVIETACRLRDMLAAEGLASWQKNHDARQP
jgi:hypothetical protein